MKAYIFDLDGVLVTTDVFHYLAWKKMADRIGLYFDEEINNHLRGVSRMESLDIILEKSMVQYSADEKTALAEEKNRYYTELLKGMSPADVSQEVRYILKELKYRGHKIAIGSSSKNTKFILQQVGLMNEFDAVSDGSNITRSKPDPEVFIKAADFLNENPDNCVVVEDASSGIEAAKACGMLAVGIGEAAKCPNADYRIERFAELFRELVL